jgi:S-adenosyl methyltransferase
VHREARRCPLTAVVADFHPAAVASTATAAYEAATAPLVLRPRAAIEAFLDGFTPEPPGLVQAPLWHPDTTPKPKT